MNSPECERKCIYNHNKTARTLWMQNSRWFAFILDICSKLPHEVCMAFGFASLQTTTRANYVSLKSRIHCLCTVRRVYKVQVGLKKQLTLFLNKTLSCAQHTIYIYIFNQTFEWELLEKHRIEITPLRICNAMHHSQWVTLIPLRSVFWTMLRWFCAPYE